MKLTEIFDITFIDKNLPKKIKSLKRILSERNVSQEYFAELIGYSVSGYAKIERAETDLTIAKLENIANILGISIITLLFFGNDKIENYEN